MLLANELDQHNVDRFWDRVSPEPMSGCWLWVGGLYQNGYGDFEVKRRCSRKHYLAHRLAYSLENKVDLDPATVIRHMCDVRWCVNPAHLEPGTHRDNVQDCIRRGRFRTGRANAEKTHCKYGHEFTEENTRYYSYPRSRQPTRICRTCHRETARRAYRESR